jgi:hypothetical protein
MHHEGPGHDEEDPCRSCRGGHLPQDEVRGAHEEDESEGDEGHREGEVGPPEGVEDEEGGDDVQGPGREDGGEEGRCCRGDAVREGDEEEDRPRREEGARGKNFVREGREELLHEGIVAGVEDGREHHEGHPEHTGYSLRSG